MTMPSSFAEALDVILARRLAEVHTAIPARVESYDASTQTCDCTPLVRSMREDEEGELVDEPLPVLPHVPVVWPGGGGFRMTFPLKKGDSVLVVFSESAIGTWQKTGNQQPADARRHHLADGIAIPGLHADPKAWKGAEDDVVTIGSDGGAAEFVAIAKKTKEALDAIVSGFNGHTHTVETAGTAAKQSGTTATPKGISPNTDVASATVKVKG
jgi:hypothetical protein